MGPPYGKLPILFPYHSHVRIPKDMGMVWVPLTKKGVPLLGVPGITLELTPPTCKRLSRHRYLPPRPSPASRGTRGPATPSMSTGKFHGFKGASPREVPNVR